MLLILAILTLLAALRLRRGAASPATSQAAANEVVP
jgi:hypothetical protein